MQGISDNPSESSPYKKRRFMPKLPQKKVKAATADMISQQEQEIVTREMLDKMKLSRGDTKRKPAEVLNSEELGIGGLSNSIRSFGTGSAVGGSKKDQGVNFASSSKSSKKDKSQGKAFCDPIILPLSPGRNQTKESKMPADNQIHSEISKTPAEELALMSEKPQMFLIQFPTSLPLSKQTGNSVKEKGNQGSEGGLEFECSLQDLPSGLVGKMLVYKSGKVKMKMGDTLFEVSPGIRPLCPENVVAINTKEKHCCSLGEIDNHIVVTPDLDFLEDYAG